MDLKNIEPAERAEARLAQAQGMLDIIDASWSDDLIKAVVGTRVSREGGFVSPPRAIREALSGIRALISDALDALEEAESASAARSAAKLAENRD